MAEPTVNIHLIGENYKAVELNNLCKSYQKSITDNIYQLLEDYLLNYREDYKPKLSPLLTQNTYEALMLSFLLGCEHVWSNVDLADVVREPLSFEEAILFLQSRIPLTKEEYEEIDKRLQFRAFVVSRLTQLDAIERVRKLLQKAIKEGKTQEQFIEEMGMDTIMQKAGFSETNPWYWETVFRTNIQTAYNAGRAYQIAKQPVEYLEFVGITDSRQTHICKARNGVIRPKNDPFWAANWPPLHFNCRSTVRPLPKEEYKMYRLKTTPPSKIKSFPSPLDGFGSNPAQSGSFYKLTPKMVKRLKKYGIYEEIKNAAKKLNIKESDIQI